MILEEFDETINSTFDPYEVTNVKENFPKIGVTCFSMKLFDRLVNVVESDFARLEYTDAIKILENCQI